MAVVSLEQHARRPGRRRCRRAGRPALLGGGLHKTSQMSHRRNFESMSGLEVDICRGATFGVIRICILDIRLSAVDA